MTSDWREQAACRGKTAVFYPEAGFRGGYNPALKAQVKAARAVCATCSVKDACLAHALAEDEPEGIWGGLTVAQRRRSVGKKVTGEKPINHGTLGGYVAHCRRGIEPCDPCRSANATYQRLRSFQRRMAS